MSKAGAKVRALAAEAVDAVISRGRSLDDALVEVEQRAAAKDHALLRMLSFGVIRSHWRLQWWAKQILDKPIKSRDSVVRALLHVGLYQLVDTRIPDHAAVSATVDAARLLKRPRHAGMLNAVLRRFMREDLSQRTPDNTESQHDHPGWLIEQLKDDWPDDWQQILQANNERAPMWLRTNRQRNSRDEYMRELQAAGIESITMDGWPDGLRLEHPQPVRDLPGFDDGRVSVQDAAAQIAAPWLIDRPSLRVLDACAAPGGKTAHLIECGAAEVTALDADEQRLDAVRQNLERLDLRATVLHGDASTPEGWWNQEPFDRILLDAPCSATGVIRRHPDIKLLRRAADIDALAGRQMAILQALWPLLRPGGRLLYVTCSVLQAENDGIISRFLDETAGVKEINMLHNNNIRAVMRDKACGVQVLPGTAGMDGFYFACLEKVS